MAFELGRAHGRRPRPTMNVTPLVDVVLVLLITFMVITPLLTRTFWVHVPEQRTEAVDRQELERDPMPPLVVRVDHDQTLRMNGIEMPLEELPSRIRRMFAAREDHIVFFDADDAVGYGFAVQVMDRLRDGGAVTIAMLTEPLGGSPSEP